MCLFSKRPFFYGRAVGNPLKMAAFIKNRDFLDQVEDYQFAKSKFVIWSSFFGDYKDAYESAHRQKQRHLEEYSSATSYSAVQHLAGFLRLAENTTGRQSAVIFECSKQVALQ